MANKSVARLKKIRDEAAAFLQGRRVELRDEVHLSPVERVYYFVLLVARNFMLNHCPVRATALAYTTLLALIPLLAVVVSIYSSVLKKEGQDSIRKIIDQAVFYVAPQLDLVDNTNRAGLKLDAAEANTKPPAGREQVVLRIYEFIDNINGRTLGATGMISLILVAILLLSNIEQTFNDIWGVSRGRSWYARIVHYWTGITLGPIVLVGALGLSSSPHLAATKVLVASAPFIGKFILGVFLPFALLIGGFTLLYLLMPNTSVGWKAALVGGLVGGSLLQLNSLSNMVYVSRVITYSNIYGSLATLPLFLIGLYFSWLIVLFGAQVAYTFQNRKVFLQEQLADKVSQSGREFIALRLMTYIASRFFRGEPVPTLTSLSLDLTVPTRLAAQVVHVLVEAKILVEVAGEEVAYMPARPLDQITCADVLKAMRSGQGNDLATREEDSREVVRQELDRIRQAEWTTAAGATLQVLVDRLAKPPAAGNAA